MQSADGTEGWELLQNEIEIARRLAIAALQVWATVAAKLNGLALLRPIDVLVVSGPGFPLRMLLRAPQRSHFEPNPIAIGNLHKLTVAFARGRRPPCILGPEHLSRIVVEEDDSQRGRFLAVRLRDVSRW